MSKFLSFSRIVLVRSLFLWIFYKKKAEIFQNHCLPLSIDEQIELALIEIRALMSSCYVISCCSMLPKQIVQLDGHLYSWDIWICEYTVLLSEFWVI